MHEASGLMLERRPRLYAVVPQGPFGCVVTARRPGQDLRAVPTEALRELALEHRLVLLRGFAPFPGNTVEDYCATWGPLLAWNFGHVLNLAVHEQPKNYLFTNGNVPLHWDGAFAAVVPSFQFFQCVRAPLPGAGGETTFVDTTRVWEQADDADRRLWERVQVTYATEKTAHYGGRITAPLVGSHPHTGQPTLRFNEPPDAGTAPLNTPTLEFPTLTPGEADRLQARLRELFYHPRNFYAHEWQDGEMVIADNHALLHGRHAFRSHSPRHLQRVHIL